MRDIKFRGRTLGGEWKYGFYASVGDKHYVFSINGFGAMDKEEIIPESLSQYTGLKDKNGVEIWEKDVLELTTNEKNKPKYLVSVEFQDGCFMVVFDDGSKSTLNNYVGYIPVKVVGNEYENPELITPKEAQDGL